MGRNDLYDDTEQNEDEDFDLSKVEQNQDSYEECESCQ